MSELRTNMELAVKSGRTDIVKSILSTLQESDNKEHKELLENILKHPYFSGESILHLASKMDQIDIVRALLTSGMDPTVCDTQGKMAYAVCSSEKTKSVYREVLLQAASQSDVALLQQLIDCGLDINFVDAEESGNTPLHWAASFADTHTVDCLCRHGADVHSVNKAGCCPIHDAVVRGNHYVVRCLLKYGADPQTQIAHGKYAGKTAYELAEGKPEVVEVLNNPPSLIQVPAAKQTENQSSGQPLANGDVPNQLASQLTNHEAAKEESSLPQLMSPVFKSILHVDGGSDPPSVVTEEKLSLLWPQPQLISQQQGQPFIAKHELNVFISAGPGAAVRDVRRKWLLFVDRFEQLQLHVLVEPLSPLISPGLAHVQCHVNARLCPGRGSYRITITDTQLKILCNDCDSLHYALATLLQLFTFYKNKDTGEITLPPLFIDDWPAMPFRGCLLDVSQGRVPNMETMKETVKTLSLLKVNQLHLYTRFRVLDQYAWQVCYSMQQLLELDEFCHCCGLQLVPVLEVAPAVQYEDVSQLYPVFQDFLTCFSFNEFVSVGPRLSSFLLDVGDDNDLNMTDSSTLIPVRSDQTLQMCGYPLHDLNSTILTQLNPQVMFNEYGVQASHNYNEFCGPLSKHGVSFMVCPGTGAWSSLAGCPEAAVTTVYRASQTAITLGALGLLVCHWSGKGHLTHLQFAWPSFLIAAGLSWNTTAHWEFCLSRLEELLNLHVFGAGQGVVGHALVELGRAETFLLRCSRQQSREDIADLPADGGSLLFQLLVQPDNIDLQHLSQDTFQRVARHVRKCQTELKTVEPNCAQGKSIMVELQHTCDLMLLATKIGRALAASGRNPSGQAGYDVVNLGISNLSATIKTDLANRLLELLEVYKSLWKSRYLEHGLQYSLAGMQAVLKQFIPDGDQRLSDAS